MSSDTGEVECRAEKMKKNKEVKRRIEIRVQRDAGIEKRDEELESGGERQVPSRPRGFFTAADQIQEKKDKKDERRGRGAPTSLRDVAADLPPLYIILSIDIPLEYQLLVGSKYSGAAEWSGG